MKLLILLALASLAFAKQNNHPRGETKDICYYCKANVQKLSVLLDNTQTQKQIQLGAKAFCAALQSPLKEMCSKSVKDIPWPFIIPFLKQPAYTCTQLHMCKNGDQQPVGIGEVVASVLASVPDEKSRNQLQNKLSSMCGWLPPSHHSICRSLIRSSSDNQSTRMMMMDIIIPCDTCENFVQLLYASFSNKQTQENIAGYLQIGCGVVSNDTSVQMECFKLVTNYLDEFWNILVAELDHGKEICQVVGCVVVPTTTPPPTTTTTKDTTTPAATTKPRKTTKPGNPTTKSPTTNTATTKSGTNGK